MAKKVVCGGGGGSNGAAMTFLDSLVDRFARPAIPADGNVFTAQMYFERANGRIASIDRARRILNKLVASGELSRGYKSEGEGHPVAWFWPAPKPPKRGAN